MMTTNYEILVTNDPSRQKKDARNRHTVYADYLTTLNLAWYLPNLDAYRGYLLSELQLAPSSVASYMGAIRTRYKELLAQEGIWEKIAAELPPHADKQQMLAHSRQLMEYATSRDAGRVQVERIISLTYLTTAQIDELFAQIKIGTLQGLRDATAIGLMLCSGIGEEEVVALQVSDIDYKGNDLVDLHIPQTASGPERLVSCYDNILFDTEWVDMYLKTWLHVMHIDEGPIMRGFFRGGYEINGKPLTGRGLQKALKSYAIPGENGQETFTVLDLQRTYARRLYLAGEEVDTIKTNLGHQTMRTTLEYIGPPANPKLPDSDLPAHGLPLVLKLDDHWAKYQ